MSTDPPPSRAGNVAEVFGSLSDDDLRSIWQRMVIRTRRAFNQGVGFFVVVLFCLVAASLAGRTLFFLDRAYDELILERVDRLLGTEHEPRGNYTKPGFMASVLANVNRSIEPGGMGTSGDWGCPMERSSCRAMEAFLDNMQILTRLVLEAEAAELASPSSHALASASPLDSSGQHGSEPRSARCSGSTYPADNDSLVRLQSSLAQISIPGRLDQGERNALQDDMRAKIEQILCTMRSLSRAEPVPAAPTASPASLETHQLGVGAANESADTRAHAPRGLHVCERLIPDLERMRRIATLGPAFCESANGRWGTSTYLSVHTTKEASDRAEAPVNPSSARSPSAAPLRFPDRIHRAVAISSVMNSALLISSRFLEADSSSQADCTTPNARKERIPADPEDAPRWVQAYFISPGNVLRIWSPENPHPGERFQGNEVWTRSNYFTKLLYDSDKRIYTSKAYLDAGGNGLVRTSCVPLDAPEGRPEQDWLGVACADFAIPEDRFVREVAKSPFFHVIRSTIQTRADLSEVQPTVEFVKRTARRDRTAKASNSLEPVIEFEMGTPYTPTMLNRGRGEDRTRRNELRNAIHAALIGTGSISDVKTKIIDISIGSEIGYWVPLTVRPDGVLSALVLVPRVPDRVAIWWSGGLMVLFGAVLLTCITLGFSQTRRTITEHGRIDMLRNLQVGVIAVSEDDRVEVANDRAEEILGMSLPKSQNRPGRIFSAIVADEIANEREVNGGRDEGGEQQSGKLHSNRLFQPYESVGRLRALGIQSSYYARLRNVADEQPNDLKWIRVSASPVLLPWSGSFRPQRSTPVNFGVIERVPASLADYLEAQRRQHLESRRATR